MNFPSCKFTLVADRKSRGDDSACTMDWLGGEAWVTPPAVSIASFAAANEARREEAASDWIPL